MKTETQFIDGLSGKEDYQINLEHYQNKETLEELSKEECEARERSEGNDQYEESIDNELAFS